MIIPTSGMGLKQVSCGPTRFPVPRDLTELIKSMKAIHRARGAKDSHSPHIHDLSASQVKSILLSLDCNEYLDYSILDIDGFKEELTKPEYYRARMNYAESIEFLGEIIEINLVGPRFPSRGTINNIDMAFARKRSREEIRSDINYAIKLNQQILDTDPSDWLDRIIAIDSVDRDSLKFYKCVNTVRCDNCGSMVDASMVDMHQSRPTCARAIALQAGTTLAYQFAHAFSVEDRLKGVAASNLMTHERNMAHGSATMPEDYMKIQAVWPLVHKYVKLVPVKYEIRFPPWMDDAIRLYTNTQLDETMTFEDYLKSVIEGKENGS